MTYGSSKWRDWVLDEEKARPFYKRALEKGINFFDTADMYSLGASEEVTGRALRDFAKRDEVVVATKVFNRMGPDPNATASRASTSSHGIDASLKRLGMDHVDLYQIHRWDSETPIEETLEALNDVVRSGKARYIGASSMYAWQFMKALAISDRHGWARFVSMQDHYNLVYREEEREMIPLCIDQGVGVIPWSPLARGFLAGNRTKEKGGATTRSKSDEYAHGMYYQDDDFAVVERLRAVAGQVGCTMPQAAMAWMLSKPGLTAPIVGASKPEHLDQAVDAVALRLTAEQVKALEEPYRPHRIMGH